MKIVFLDRDGVINKYPGNRKYVTSLKRFRLIPYAKRALKILSDEGFNIFIISNQAGVGKKIYSQRTLNLITDNMLHTLNRSGINISHVYYCIHRQEDNCQCRKPKPGLIKKAIREFNVPKYSLKHAFFVGDSVFDILTAKKAGCKSILVFSGKEKPKDILKLEIQPDFTAKDLFHAVKIILKDKSA